MIVNEKRLLVEEWFNSLCQSCDILLSAEDDYHRGEHSAQIDEILAEAEGFISFVEYSPYSDEWENFEPEGYLWRSPNDSQVEKLYPKATKWREELESYGG